MTFVYFRGGCKQLTHLPQKQLPQVVGRFDWLSEVEGSEDRNIILNWWFAMHPEKIQQAFRVPTPEFGALGVPTAKGGYVTPENA